jgi:hypothetical protein
VEGIASFLTIQTKRRWIMINLKDYDYDDGVFKRRELTTKGIGVDMELFYLSDEKQNEMIYVQRMN